VSLLLQRATDMTDVGAPLRSAAPSCGSLKTRTDHQFFSTRSAQDANGALCTAGRTPKWPRAGAELHGTADGGRDGDDGSLLSIRLWVGGGAR